LHGCLSRGSCACAGTGSKPAQVDNPVASRQCFYGLGAAGHGKPMGRVTLATPGPGDAEKGESRLEIMLDGRRVGAAVVYYAEKEDIGAFKSMIKRARRGEKGAGGRVQIGFGAGDPYTAKVHLDEGLGEDAMREISGETERSFPTCPASRIFFLRREGRRLIPLTTGERLRGV